MTKQEYFKMIREINKELRKQGMSWQQTYTEPRKKTGYRTKLYYAMYDPSKKVFDSLAAWEVVHEVSEGRVEAKRFVGKNHYGHSVVNLVMTPTEPITQ